MLISLTRYTVRYLFGLNQAHFSGYWSHCPFLWREQLYPSLHNLLRTLQVPHSQPTVLYFHKLHCHFRSVLIYWYCFHCHIFHQRNVPLESVRGTSSDLWVAWIFFRSHFRDFPSFLERGEILENRGDSFSCESFLFVKKKNYTNLPFKCFCAFQIFWITEVCML